MKSYHQLKILSGCSLLLLLLVSAAPAAAQDEAVVEVLAQLMSLEDSRRYNGVLLRDAARHPEAIVRRHAALAMGRIGNPGATPFLQELLLDTSPDVQADAAFAMGLIGDTTGFARLRETVLNTPVADQHEGHSEAVTAIMRIGGPEAAAFAREYLTRFAGTADRELPLAVVRALAESWRLGADAPVDLLRRFVDSGDRDVRWSTIYSLSRLQDPTTADLLLAALNDSLSLIRYTAVRALTRDFADSSGLDRDAVAARVLPLVNDDSVFVRVNAIRTLGTFADPRHARDVVDRTSDSDPNVRVQAAASLGLIGGPEAVRSLRAQARDRLFAVRREALMSLALIPESGVIDAVAGLVASDDWRERMTAAQVLGQAGGDTALAWLDHLSRDDDGRVTAAALEGIMKVDSAYGSQLAREYVLHPDFVARVHAANRIGLDGGAADVRFLADAYQLALGDHQSDARIAVVRALGAISIRGPSERVAVESGFLSRFPRPSDYLVRRVAAEHFPEAARRWGPERPVETTRSMGDYRDLVRDLVIPAEAGSQSPRIKIETDRGEIVIRLYAADVPLTVQALLELLALRSLDDGAWHRVVPNFVLQDGDPRGDGWGQPNYVLRDELNRRRYERGTVGMALDGPDTGGSQFFITHSPQPHLNGTFTVIGRVESGYNVIAGITQGDRIRRIRRE